MKVKQQEKEQKYKIYFINLDEARIAIWDDLTTRYFSASCLLESADCFIFFWVAPEVVV